MNPYWHSSLVSPHRPLVHVADDMTHRSSMRHRIQTPAVMSFTTLSPHRRIPANRMRSSGSSEHLRGRDVRPQPWIQAGDGAARWPYADLKAPAQAGSLEDFLKTARGEDGCRAEGHRELDRCTKHCCCDNISLPRSLWQARSFGPPALPTTQGLWRLRYMLVCTDLAHVA